MYFIDLLNVSGLGIDSLIFFTWCISGGGCAYTECTCMSLTIRVNSAYLGSEYRDKQRGQGCVLLVGICCKSYSFIFLHLRERKKEGKRQRNI